MAQVIVGGFAHESNTFTPEMTKWDDFTLHDGAALEAWVKQSRGEELHGAAQVFEEMGVDVHYAVAAGGSVGGIVMRSIFSEYMNRLYRALQRAPDVNGVLWALHGSATVEDEADAQLRIVQAIRERYPAVPFVVTLDLHASLCDEALTLLDGVAAYRTAPHRDVEETGARGASMLARLIADGQRGRIVSVRLPLLLPGEFGQTDAWPMTAVMERAARLAGEEDALEISVLQGYPWADNPFGTVSLLASTRRGRHEGLLAERLVTLARQVWAQRADFYQSTPVLPLEDALETAQRKSQTELLVLCDAGDNPTAGGTEDRVDALKAALRSECRDMVFFPVVDAAYAHACQGKQGQAVQLPLGFSIDPTGGAPLVFTASVLAAGSDEAVGEHAFVQAGGVRVFVCARRMAMRSPQLLADYGVDMSDAAQALVVKSGYLFPKWQDFLRAADARSILLGTPGATSLDLRTFSYRLLATDVYPLRDPVDAQASVCVCGAGGWRSKWTAQLRPAGNAGE